jgi:predicted dehydrogenase
MSRETYGVAIQGAAGSWGAMHLDAYLVNPKVRVVALCDLDLDGAKHRAESACLNCKIYTDYEKVLADTEVDIVSIVTPSCYHARDAIMAMQAGKHILVEKPIATTPDDLALLKRASSETKVKTMAGFVLRWNGMVKTLKSLMTEHIIGDVFMAQADYWQNVGWLDAGSSLLAGGCHPFDTVRWLMGGEEAEEVFAYSTNFGYPEWDHNPTTLALMRMRNGAVCKVACTLEPSAPYMLRVELLGTEGTILNNKLYVRRWKTQEEYVEIPCGIPGLASLVEPMREEISHFIDCIDQNIESHVNLQDAIKTHEALMAADLSAAQAKPIALPLI